MAKKTLNISFYTDTYLPAIDGVTSSIRDFKRELESRGHTIKILTSGNSKTRSQMAGRKNILVAPGIQFAKYPQYHLSVMPFIDVGKKWASNVDIIHVHTPFTIGVYGILSAYVNHLPVVWTFHTLFTNKDTMSQYGPKNRGMKKIAKKYTWSYIRFLSKRCDVVIAPSETVKRLLSRKRIKNVVVVPNGVDLKRFRPHNDMRTRELRRRLLRGNKHIVLYVGRVSKEKNIDTMIRAAALLKGKSISFVIVGEGPYLERLESMARRAGLEQNILFIGKVNRRLPLYYNSADVVCLPSTFETQGIVSLEAMACDKPVVGADYLALKEVIHNGKNGEKFIPKDYKDCAKKIEKVINNIRSYKGMRRTAENYSIESSTDKLLDVYRRLISKKTDSILLRSKRKFSNGAARRERV